jgi:hypothetical protein
VAQQALDLNFSGLMIETHWDPDRALSDAEQQLEPKALGRLLASLIFREAAPSEQMHDRLQELRDLIDQLDEEIAQKLGRAWTSPSASGTINTPITWPSAARTMGADHAATAATGPAPGPRAGLHRRADERDPQGEHPAPDGRG